MAGFRSGNGGTNVEDVRKAIDGLNGKAARNMDTVVVQSVAELPEHLQAEYAGRETEVEALYDPTTGKIWFVADNLESVDRAKKVWAHEQIGHFGLNSLYKDKAARDRVLNALWLKLGGLKNSLVAQLAQEYGLDPLHNAEDRVVLMEEVVAHLAEKHAANMLNSEERTLWKKIVHAILQAWHKFVDAVTDKQGTLDYSDMDALLKDLGAYVWEGRHRRGVYNREKAAVQRELARIEQEIAKAVDGNGNVRKQLEEMNRKYGSRDTIEDVVRTYTGIVRRLARRMEKAGMPVSDFLASLNFKNGEFFGQDEAFYQDGLKEVDFDAPVKVVEIKPQFAGYPQGYAKILRKRFPEEVKNKVLKAFSGEGVVNADTGLRIGMSSRNFHEHMKFDDSNLDEMIHFEAIAALPELMRTAKFVESFKKKDKNNEGLKNVHRFQAALRVNEKDYSVKLTVKEYEDGRLELDSDTPLRCYHHKIEKEMPAGTSGDGLVPDNRQPSADNESNAGNSETNQTHDDIQPSANIHAYKLRDLLKDVKDHEGNVFFQTAWHGSPHRFLKFSLDHIGSGEGSQIHGWGLYFALNKERAEEYHKALTFSFLVVNGELHKYDPKYGFWRSKVTGKGWKETEAEKKAVYAFKFNGQSIEKAIESLRNDANKDKVKEEALHLLESGTLKLEQPVGQIFKVEIPDSDVLLDEQKRFSEQPKKVREALNYLFLMRKDDPRFLNLVGHDIFGMDESQFVGKFRGLRYEELMYSCATSDLENIVREAKKGTVTKLTDLPDYYVSELTEAGMLEEEILYTIQDQELAEEYLEYYAQGKWAKKMADIKKDWPRQKTFIFRR